MDVKNEQLVYEASASGDKETVVKLLDDGADINYVYLCLSVLGIAVSNGRTDMVKLLISRQVDVNKKDRANKSAIHYACINGHVDCASLLINAECDVTETDNLGRDAVLYACYYGNVEILKLLLKHNGSLTTTDENGNGVMHIACSGGHLDVVKHLMACQSNDISLDSVNKDGDGVMHKACFGGHIDVIKYLLSKGFSLASPVNKNGKSPWMLLKEEIFYNEDITKRRKHCLQELQSLNVNHETTTTDAEESIPGTSLNHSDKLTLDNVFSLLKGKSSQWDDIGRALGVSSDYRLSLLRDASFCGGNNGRRLELVLDQWLESDVPTWSDFIEILTDSLTFNEIARQTRCFVSHTFQQSD